VQIKLPEKGAITSGSTVLGVPATSPYQLDVVSGQLIWPSRSRRWPASNRLQRRRPRKWDLGDV
jgi:hypothetical protein